MGFVYGIKQKLSDWSDNSQFGKLVFYHSEYAVARCLGAVMSKETYANWFYHLYTGKQLNLKDPKYFDEKIWWLKLYNRDPMLTICSDKHAVREYVKECGYEDILMPQMEVLESVDQLDFEKYDYEVVAKCTHNSGGHIFWDPNDPMPENDLKLSKERLDFILHHNPSVLHCEWNYKNIPPRIVVEKVIRDKKGDLPSDYKFMCFDGEPKLLFLDLGVITEDRKYNHNYPRNIYDMDFNLMPFHETRPNADYEVEKPENFERMVEIARKLSQPFPHCRVDLYNMDGKIYFGEITFYHGGGCNDIQSEEWDLKMGSWIDLDSPKIVRENGKK